MLAGRDERSGTGHAVVSCYSSSPVILLSVTQSRVTSGQTEEREREGRMRTTHPREGISLCIETKIVCAASVRKDINTTHLGGLIGQIRQIRFSVGRHQTAYLCAIQ